MDKIKIKRKWKHIFYDSERNVERHKLSLLKKLLIINKPYDKELFIIIEKKRELKILKGLGIFFKTINKKISKKRIHSKLWIKNSLSEIDININIVKLRLEGLYFQRKKLENLL